MRKTLGAGLASLLFAALLWAAYQPAREHFLAQTAERGRTLLALQAENLRGWLDRYRALPRIYAESTALRSLLTLPQDETLARRVNERLAIWNAASGAADTYVLDRAGTAIAASNWADPITFVGKNYSYRPYYTQAMQRRLGRFFALGTASGKRGYYFSYPVLEQGRVLGSVVVKAGVAAIEQELAAGPYEILITGPDGVVLLAGNPDWRLKTLGPLTTRVQEAILANRQYDLSALTPLDFDAAAFAPAEGRPLRIETSQAAGSYLQLTEAMPVEGWTLHLLVPTGPARAQSLNAVLLVGLVLLAVGLIVALLWQRRRRLIERLRAREEAQATLTRTVAARTADLRQANLALEAEVGERKTAEAELRRTQSELIQAGKLAALGQMSAALSHEFNQPLTAMRSYADNAAAFLERGQTDRVESNLTAIGKLIDRTAELSRHLRSFARRPQIEARPVSLTAVVKESLTLLEGQIAKAGVTLDLDLSSDSLWVRGGHVRLQQVVVNLLSNALDAVRQTAEAKIALSTALADGRVSVRVEDSGPGLPLEDPERIFDPFFTTKEVGQGLGLGLSISFNIVKDFGGSLEAGSSPLGGARFLVTLQAAEQSGERPSRQRVAAE
ncbi:MAG: sensor histidine kinase [Rhodospirillales bacterium]